MLACKAKAAPTTRNLMARRFDESKMAIARIRAIPATLNKICITSPPLM